MEFVTYFEICILFTLMFKIYKAHPTIRISSFYENLKNLFFLYKAFTKNLNNENK